MVTTFHMVSKRDLGVSYFLGTGLGLIASLIGYLLLVDGSADIASLGTITALGLAGSLPYLGWWLWHSDLSDSAVWVVARWCAVGIALPTVTAGAILVAGFRPQFVLRFPHLFVNFISAGGVVGALLGLIFELRHQYFRAEELNRRNNILNHVMRHNIRNDINVIKAYTGMIADHLDAEEAELVTPVERKLEQIIETSTIARQVQSLEDDPDRKPTDIVEMVSAYAADARETYPEATITTDLPAEAWADAGDLFRSVIDNLVENAIEHTDQPPEVTIEVRTTEDHQVVLRVADNGPGIPERVRRSVLTDPDPTSVEQTGLGLWLVKWVVDGYDGTLSFEDRDPRGSVVQVNLPAATRQTLPAGR